MKIFKFVLFIIFTLPFTIFGQVVENTPTPTSTISHAFEQQDPQQEIYRLQSKRENLLYRINVLRQDSLTHHDEIVRTQAMVNYLDNKIETLKHTLASEEFAKNTNAPNKNELSSEEYIIERKAWEDSIRNTNTNTNIPIKTTLKRYEFEKLPLPQQEKILSMPERYIIID